MTGKRTDKDEQPAERVENGFLEESDPEEGADQESSPDAVSAAAKEETQEAGSGDNQESQVEDQDDPEEVTRKETTKEGSSGETEVIENGQREQTSKTNEELPAAPQFTQEQGVPSRPASLEEEGHWNTRQHVSDSAGVDTQGNSDESERKENQETRHPEGSDSMLNECLITENGHLDGSRQSATYTEQMSPEGHEVTVALSLCGDILPTTAAEACTSSFLHRSRVNSISPVR